MSSDDDRKYTLENPHPADEDLSQTVKEFIYEDPDALPELDWPDEDEEDPIMNGERIGLEDDGE